MNDMLGKVHFWLSLIFMNVVFQPMFQQGMAGMIRRMYNGGATYAADAVSGEIGLSSYIIGLNKYVSMGAWFLCLAQIPFIVNFFWSIRNGKKITSDNPWDATTVEWQTPTPPPHGNFSQPIEVHRGPYEYSVPGHATDFTLQTQPEKGSKH
jgi:cytochrome c oxidase subunit 1